jgi:tRNA(fMet)-specific endonuclease VapC
VNYMLDTNTLIYLIKQRPAAVGKKVDALGEGAGLCMSFFTYAELLKGALRSTSQADVLRQLAALVGQVPVVYAGSAALCEQYAHHSNRLKDAGTPIGANDLWIACHALADGCVLVSNNLRELRRIKGLKLENWAV